MAARPDNRHQVTFKHAGLTPEWLARIKAAAKAQGMPMGAFVYHALNEAAVAVLKARGEGQGTPQGTPHEQGTPGSTPPVRLDDLADDLMTRTAELMERQRREILEEVASMLPAREEEPRAVPQAVELRETRGERLARVRARRVKR